MASTLDFGVSKSELVTFFAKAVRDFTQESSAKLLATVKLDSKFANLDIQFALKEFGEYEYRVVYPLIKLCIEDDSYHPRLTDTFNRLCDTIKTEAAKTTKSEKIITRTAIREECPILGDMEAELDNFLTTGNFVKSKKQHIPTTHATKLRQWATKKSEYFQSVIEQKKTNDDIAEGWSNISNAQLKAMSRWLLDQVTLYKVDRSTKTNKPRNSALKASKMKFKMSDDALGLKSIAPVHIIGAKGVWVYDTDKRMLIKFVAQIGTKLSVSGTTIRNIREDASVRKNVRLPENCFEQIKNNNKQDQKVIQQIFDGINSKMLTVTSGRTNANMIILAVI